MDQPQQQTRDESSNGEQNRRSANDADRNEQRAERRLNDVGGPEGVDRRGLTEREKRERWPIG